VAEKFKLNHKGMFPHPDLRSPETFWGTSKGLLADKSPMGCSITGGTGMKFVCHFLIFEKSIM
jgi:hypothetical protein